MYLSNHLIIQYMIHIYIYIYMLYYIFMFILSRNVILSINLNESILISVIWIWNKANFLYFIYCEELELILTAISNRSTNFESSEMFLNGLKRMGTRWRTIRYLLAFWFDSFLPIESGFCFWIYFHFISFLEYD